MIHITPHMYICVSGLLIYDMIRFHLFVDLFICLPVLVNDWLIRWVGHISHLKKLLVNLFILIDCRMSDREDFAELVGKYYHKISTLEICSIHVLVSARNVTKCPTFYFNGRIRYGTKNERLEERFLVRYWLISFFYLFLQWFIVHGCCSGVYLFNENTR